MKLMIEDFEKSVNETTPLYVVEQILRNKKEIVQLIPKPLYKVLHMNKKIVWNGKNLKTDNIATLCNMLLTKYSQTKGKRNDNLIVLNATILQKKYGCYYRKYIDYLETGGYIKRYGRYTPGVQSFKYRLTAKFLKYGTKQYVNTDAVTIKKYKANVLSAIRNKNAISGDIIKGLNFKSTDNIPNYIHIDVREKLMLDLWNVEIDSECALKFVSTIKDDLSRMFNELHVSNIEGKHIWYQFDNYGRFHSNYTILKRHIREKCLTINGEEIEELDIKNSQPLLLAKIIKDSGKVGDFVDKNEFETFCELVKEGRLYQHFIDVYKYKDKSDVKKNLIYKVLFGENGTHKDKANKIFRKAFPTIHDFIKNYKSSKKSYKSLSHALQRIESELIFNKIIKEIMNKDMSISLFTVHDSICFPKSYKYTIEEIFNKHVQYLIDSI